MNKDTEAKKSRFPKFVRILALVLVILFVGDLLLMNIASVDYSADSYAGDAEDMAQYIARTDEYINNGFLYRVRNAVLSMGTPETFEEYYMCASLDIADNNLSSAAEHLDRCIELFSGEDSVLSKLNVKQGCILAMDDKWDESQKYFDAAVALDSSNADAWLMLSQAAYVNKDYPKAVTAMKEYSGLGEMSVQQYTLLASMQLFNGNYDEALSACNTALSLEGCPKAEVLFMRCKANYFLGNWTDCRNDAQAAQDAGYDYNETMTMKAASYEGEKDYAGVLGILMEMIDNGTDDGSVYQNALTCAFEVDDFAAQKKIILRLLAYETDTATKLTLLPSLAMAQLQLGEFAAAKENLQFCIDNSADDIQLIYLRGICRMNLGEYVDAYKDFTQVLEAEKLIDECYYNRAVCRLGMGQRVAAQSELKEIIKRNESEKMVALAQELLDSN